MCTYVDKLGDRNDFFLLQALDSINMEMVKRLKYTKEIVQYMLSGEFLK